MTETLKEREDKVDEGDVESNVSWEDHHIGDEEEAVSCAKTGKEMVEDTVH